MTDIDIGWLAGLLEGEGCFSIFTRKTAKWDYKTVAIHCEMTDEDTVRKAHMIAGVGNVIERSNMSGRKDARQRKKTWIWSVQNHQGVLYVCETIYPHMGIRRQQKIKELIEYVKSKSSMGDT